MRHPKSTIFRSLLLSLFFLLSPPALSGSDIITESSFLNHICISFDNFTAGTPYASNLNQAFDQLTTTAPPSGFALASAGKDPQNQVNGLALCRGDVSPADCKNCVTTAAQEIQVRCPYRKGAAIWYDFCLLKYSNAKFFGKIDNRNKFYMWNVQETDNDRTSFNEQVKSLLTDLAEKVVSTQKLYVIGEVEMKKLKTLEKLYGLVQCSRDLSSGACKKCLEIAIGELPSCCDAKIGGRVVGGSCNFRYELYPIVDAQK
ncbi:cysteine-rich repeat secretory protein 38-like isoform X1 [Momordica charantia]|uniref:Cysteine-rich repeat secretory protein 38-like isoform X1 n=1 Tax=Momordica charantia TaxID=3673 RepID=A0A6J1C1U5_MOMCH|nr:cysteine-rich repeat secretory protein 38-like isoform X1 [Momordica charantia]